ncbi:MAG TPA: cytochrome b [Azospirillum sp.]
MNITSKDRYDLPMQMLHWATALLIIGAFVLIQIVEGMPKGPERAYVMMLHKSVGVSVMALVVLRAVWRRISPPPALPAGMAPPLVAASKAGHAALYVLMLLVPLSGAVMSWAGGRPIVVFDLFTLPSLIGPNPGLKEGAEEVHEVIGNLILILAGLHAVAAIVHQYVLKDGVLARMLPWGETRA